MKVVVTSVYPKQIMSYLMGMKDCEIRKSVPNPGLRGIDLGETLFVIKTAGSSKAYVLGKSAEVARGHPNELWDKYSAMYKFGITRDEFFTYYAGRQMAHIIHFREVEMIFPPLEGIPASQTYLYRSVPAVTSYPLTASDIREKLIRLTREIQETLSEKYRTNPTMLKKVA